jgi:hypothetical protein
MTRCNGRIRSQADSSNGWRLRARSHSSRGSLSDDPGARMTGGYFYHERLRDVNPAARDPELQDRLLDYCRDLSGVAL